MKATRLKNLGGFLKFYKIFIPHLNSWGVAIKDNVIQRELSEDAATKLAQYLNTEEYLNSSPKERAKAAIKIEFDFETIYQMYPRHIGKKTGIDKLKRIIQTPDKYQLLFQAVKNYAESVANVEQKFILHFSTFVNRFEDYIPDQATTQQEKLSLDEINKMMV
jgi:hypothetical protein